MTSSVKHVTRTLSAVAAATALVIAAAPNASAERWTTMDGFSAPGTPAKYNKVKVLKQGPKSAQNVLVLVPGTSAGASNFRPMAKGILARLDNWQVWSIERRENLLEDHSVLREYRDGTATSDELIDYYLGWLTDPNVDPHFSPKTTEETAFARDWGLNVAIKDIQKVVKSANKKDRNVVLGGHSLGGRITTAYAAWDFAGRPGAKDLDGLVFIDGGGASDTLPTAAEAQAKLTELSTESPFLDLLGLGLPWASGVFNALGSTTALKQPDARSALQGFPLVPSSLKPPVSATNLGQYGYSVDSDTSPSFLALVHSHIGHLATSGDPRGWVNGELGSAKRAASVFAEFGGYDGTSWYHPSRLSLDARSVNNGIANPAQDVYGVRATMGKRVKLPMYAFDAELGGGRVGEAARDLARQSGVAQKNVTTVDRSTTYAHIDPLSADPSKNAFIKTVVPFLKGIAK